VTGRAAAPFQQAFRVTRASIARGFANERHYRYLFSRLCRPSDPTWTSSRVVGPSAGRETTGRSRDDEVESIMPEMTDDGTRADDACPACRALDAADGTVDGQFFSPVTTHVRDERVMFAALARTQDRAADGITDFAGSLSFVYIHSVWFGLWIALNIGILGSTIVFDRFPFGLLTMIVSLEAIFLSTFVMVSQNRHARRDGVRSQLDFETNLRAEVWALHIGAQLGIRPDHVEDVTRRAIAAAIIAGDSEPPPSID